ncbi:MAG TPA: Ig-like domain-containing protein, partial [Anaerolineae bacterium]|nr:Ig-like domain-containing protein [Anaerolineae bacterium]
MRASRLCIKWAVVFLVVFSLVLPAHAVTYTYDELGRVKSATYDNGNTITYTYDKAGNILSVDGPSTSITTSITTDPSSPDGDAGWFKTAPTITLTPDATATTYYQWDAGVETTYTASFVAPEGEHTLSFYSMDAAGNTETTQTTQFKVDTTPPNTPALNTVDTITEANVESVTVSGTADSTTTVYITASDGVHEVTATATSSGTFSTTLNLTSLSDGLITFTASAKDVAGNISPVSLAVQAMKDAIALTTALATTPSSPDGENGWFKTAPTITLTANATATTYYQWDSTSTTGYSYSRQAREWIDGGVALNIRDDDAGNWFTLPFSFPFYGTNYNQVYLSSNGLLRFDAADTAYDNSASTLYNKAAIAPLWDDLRTDARLGDDIYVFQPDTDSIGFRWQATTLYGYDTNFEVILRKDGRIRINYGAQAGGLTPTIGISKGNGANYHIVYDGDISGTNNIDSIVYVYLSEYTYTAPFVAPEGEHTLYYYSMSSGGETSRVSISDTGEQGNAISCFPSISPDGRYVAFCSA